MKIIIEERGTITVTATINDNASCEETIVAALDVISRIYTQAQVVEAYKNVDPDGMCIMR